jgi:brefeldin A-inhibited guanine nucleotide-exchange protein
MTKEQFIRNNRGIDNGVDLPTDFLSALYDKIVGEEIRLSGGVQDGASPLADHLPPGKMQMVRTKKSRLKRTPAQPPQPLPGLSDILRRMRETFGGRAFIFNSPV